ncbi:hypothetical protein ANN_22198 [Periplaneta americana]|uniref:Uncharacterized protein n=1 Tax=Periplaneta americana TaxID=6978 RepID=A0ABQ8S7Z0_PERAM|nr:hypothetical protein ANN_22198 [Periplaneta americana]
MSPGSNAGSCPGFARNGLRKNPGINLNQSRKKEKHKRTRKKKKNKKEERKKERKRRRDDGILDEMRSEDSPKYYPAFAFSVGETSKKPNQVIKSKGLMPRTRHRPSGFSPTAGENLRRNQSPKGIQPKPERSSGSAAQRVCRLSYIDGSTKRERTEKTRSTHGEEEENPRRQGELGEKARRKQEEDEENTEGRRGERKGRRGERREKRRTQGEGRKNRGEKWLVVRQVPHHRRYHKICSVRSWLDENFRNRWIGRRGPRKWSSRSPDLNSFDFALRGYLKDKVYEVKIRDLQRIRTLIEEKCRYTTAEMLQRILNSIEVSPPDIL